jgi:uncharacterized OB-fold protein
VTKTTHETEVTKVDYSFRKRRMVGFVDAGDEFWEGLEDGVVRVSRCAQCHRWIWEPNYRCGDCGSWDIDWVEVEPVGVVYSWTRTNQVFPSVGERADEIPYVNLFVQVEGSRGPRLPGLLEGPQDGLRVGATVTGRINPPSERSKGYAFLTWSLTG